MQNLMFCLSSVLLITLAGCQSEMGTLNEAEMGAGSAEMLPHAESPEMIDMGDLVFRTEIPVVVDFSATWCGPCQILAPQMDKLAEEYAGKAIVVKLDVDENSTVSNYFRVKNIPSVIVINDAKIVKRYTGFETNMCSSIGRLLEGL